MKRLVPRARGCTAAGRGDDRPPGWVRAVLIATCGGVSFAHGSNDGQKGMGLILLVLIGFLPVALRPEPERPDTGRRGPRGRGRRPRRPRASADAESPTPAVRTDLDAIDRGPGGQGALRRGARRPSAGRSARRSTGSAGDLGRAGAAGGRARGDRARTAERFDGAIEFVPTLGGRRGGRGARGRDDGRLQADRGDGGREDRQGAHDLRPGGGGRGGGGRDHRPGRRGPHAGEHDPRPVLGRGRDDGANGSGVQGEDGPQDRPGLGADPAGRRWCSRPPCSPSAACSIPGAGAGGSRRHTASGSSSGRPPRGPPARRARSAAGGGEAPSRPRRPAPDRPGGPSASPAG